MPSPSNSQPDASPNQLSERKAASWKSFVGCAFWAGVFAIFLCLATWIINGTSTAMRAATDLAMPVGLLWLAIFATAVAAFRFGDRRHFVAACLAFLVFGTLFNGRFAGSMMRNLEYPAQRHPLDPHFDQYFDAVISLGGYASVNRFGVDEVGTDGMRMLLAAQIWNAGLTNRIICTGASPISDDPSVIGRRLLESIGVPGNAIIELGGENTSGEMKCIREFLDEAPAGWAAPLDGVTPKTSNAVDDGTGPKIGLITSAFHLPRAMRLARAAGLEFQPLPCVYSGSPTETFSPRVLIPNAAAGKSLAVVLKEMLARLLGR